VRIPLPSVIKGYGQCLGKTRIKTSTNASGTQPGEYSPEKAFLEEFTLVYGWIHIVCLWLYMCVRIRMYTCTRLYVCTRACTGVLMMCVHTCVNVRNINVCLCLLFSVRTND